MYNFYPLLAGFVALPPLQLKPLTSENISQGALDDVITRYVPTHIFVLVRWSFSHLSLKLFKSNIDFQAPIESVDRRNGSDNRNEITTEEAFK